MPGGLPPAPPPDPLTPAPPVPFTPGPPVAPAAAMPATQQMQPAPEPPKRAPSVVTRDSVIRQPRRSEEISNPFERQASMILDSAEGQAQRLSENLGEAPAGSDPVSNETVHEMWHFSPFGQDAPREFWRQHDQMLTEAINNGDPDPYAVAEHTALQAVYPYRAELAQMDHLSPEQKVKRANELRAQTEREVQKGNTPDSMPTLVGPKGLPSPTNPSPDQPAFNPQFAPKPEPLPNSGNPATMGGPSS